MSNRPKAERVTHKRVVGLFTDNRRGDALGYNCLRKWGRLQGLLSGRIRLA